MKALVCLSALVLTSCSSLIQTDFKFKVRMQGSFDQPSTHDGSETYNSEPLQAIFTIKEVNLLRENADAISLYSDAPKDLKIVDRGQIIYQKTIDDDLRLNDAGATESYTGIQVVLDTPWTCVTNKGEVSLTLASGTIELTESFTIAKAQDKTFTINVKWKDIVSSDGLDCQAPEFEMVSTTTYD